MIRDLTIKCADDCKDLMDQCSDILKRSVTLTGFDLQDLSDLDDLEDDQKLLIFDCITLYSKLMNYSIEQASLFDQVNERLEQVLNQLDKIEKKIK